MRINWHNLKYLRKALFMCSMLNCLNFLIAKIKMESWKIKKKYFISFGWHCIENSLTLAIFPDLDLFSRRCVCRTPIGGETLMVPNKCDLKNVKLMIVEEKNTKAKVKIKLLIKYLSTISTHNFLTFHIYYKRVCWLSTYTKGCHNKVFSLIHILKTLINFFS